MRKHSRYRGGRRSVGLLIPVLVMLCIIAAAALYVINNNMTFTKEGSFFIPEKEKAPQNVETNLIIEEPEEEQSAEAPVVVVDKADTASVRAYFVPVGAVKSAELFDAELALAKTAGADTLVLEVKAEDGTLAFSTKTRIGMSTGLAGESATLSDCIAKARAGSFRIALYMSCFKDNEAARKNQIYAVSTANKVIWLDGENMRWLSPYSEEACAYLTETVAELAAFAPDEIILANISFPTFGKTDIVKYEDGGKSKSECLKDFISTAKAAAGQVKVSAVYENYKDNILERSGQTAEIFAESFDTVYIKESAGDRTKAFNDSAGEFKRAVPIKAIPVGDEYMIKK